MKRIITAAILFVGTALGGVTRASAQEQGVRAKVPFDFVVENRTLPAGTYRIRPHGDFLQIDRVDGDAAIYTTRFPGETTANGRSELYFDVVGGERFLRRVASPVSATSIVFLPCKREKEAQSVRASNDGTKVINAVSSGR